jgi:hypothetical protein
VKAATKKEAPVKLESGTRIRKLILKPMANHAILVIIQKEVKGANTTAGDVTRNRSMLKAPDDYFPSCFLRTIASFVRL